MPIDSNDCPTLHCDATSLCCMQGKYKCPGCVTKENSVGLDLFDERPGRLRTPREVFLSGSHKLHMGKIEGIFRSREPPWEHELLVRWYEAPRDRRLNLRNRKKVLMVP